MPQIYNNLIEADYLSKISTFRLRKNGFFKTYYSIGKVFEFYLIENLREYLRGKELPRDGYLLFKYQREDRNFDYKVRLTTTNCNYGNYRYWFICLLCERRIGVLYFRGGFFACRHCQYLTYESRNVGGIQKQFGRIISFPELEEIKKEVKRKFYNGKVTRKYRRYMRIEDKAYSAFFLGMSSKEERSFRELASRH